MLTCAHQGDTTIKVASKKDGKSGIIKLKKAAPKHNKPGNWRDGSVVEGTSAPAFVANRAW